MSTPDTTKPGSEMNRRRSQRAILSLPIMVRAEAGPHGAAFEEATHTLVVNAHGALISIAGAVKEGQHLRLTNRTTQQQLGCHVVYVGLVSDGKAQVGVEFDKPSPDFWPVAFPPDDWIAPEPEPATNKGTK